VSELGGDIHWPHYRRLWGEWAGREAEFYRACARLVDPLTWEQVEQICGPCVRIFADLLRDAYAHLTSGAIPERLRVGTFRFVGVESLGYRAEVYSPYDPLLMPEQVVRLLHYFALKSAWSEGWWISASWNRAPITTACYPSSAEHF
jgi:hypothetical protein